MKTTLRSIQRSVVTALAAASILSAGCQTTGGASGLGAGDGTGQRGSGSGGAEGSAGQISSKAKLLFDDATKDFEAQKKSRNYNYPALERKFQAAADADPNLAEATYNLGVLAERQGKTEAAAGYYRDALKRKPSLVMAAENLAVIAQNSGDEATAVRIYEDIQSRFPSDASSRARLAEIQRRRGENDRAIELAREALFREPNTIQAYKTMIWVYTDQRQLSLARLTALRAAKIAESDPELPYLVGLTYLAEKDLVKARAQFKRSVELRADYLPAHYQLLKMAFEQANYLSAEQHLRKILQLSGASAEALSNLGVAYKGLGQIDRAMQSYDEAQKLNPELPAVYFNKGILVALKGDPTRAIDLFRTYIAKKGDGVAYDHPVHALIEEQEQALRQREEDKRVAEEVKRMEAEMKKQEDQAAEEEKAKKDQELRERQAAAKGQGEKKAEEKKPEEKKTDTKAPPAAADPTPKSKTEAPKKGGPSDEPEDGL